MSRRLLLAAGLLIATLLISAAPAAAHPLGNFSVNHLTIVRISSDRVDVRYVLDQAEIPTFRERGLSDAEVLRRKQAEVARRLELTVDGRAAKLRPTGRAPKPSARSVPIWRRRSRTARTITTAIPAMPTINPIAR